jgi:hypothetical protein
MWEVPVEELMQYEALIISSTAFAKTSSIQALILFPDFVAARNS